MKLKTLLLGSAAAMMAVTGAHAADAVVADPEPVEYVRVCDMYGNGFFYIPGTETCLKINGRVRVQYEYEDNNDTGDSNGDFDGSARLGFDVRNETDFGTLRSFIRIASSSITTRGAAGTVVNDGDTVGVSDTQRSVFIDEAYISLAGFTFGVQESFWARNNGYGHPTIFDGDYGFQNVVMAEYTYAANGFSATAGIQGDAQVDDTELNYYAGVSYRSSAFYLAAHVLHDVDADDTAFGVSGELNVIDGLTVQGWYHIDDGGTDVIQDDADQQWGVGARYTFSNNFYVAGGYSDADGVRERLTAEVGTSFAGLGVGLAWENVDNDGGDETDSFRLRVTRSF